VEFLHGPQYEDAKSDEALLNHIYGNGAEVSTKNSPRVSSAMRSLPSLPDRNEAAVQKSAKEEEEAQKMENGETKTHDLLKKRWGDIDKDDEMLEQLTKKYAIP
jgi:hypothetical protein